MVKTSVLKIPWSTKHFNKGQKVFIKMMTGNQACKCRGKYRGSGRWITAWFSWNDKNMNLVDFKEIELSKNDYENIMY